MPYHKLPIDQQIDWVLHYAQGIARRQTRVLAAVMLASWVVFGAVSYMGDSRDDDRDTALKYQRCEQTAAAARASNDNAVTVIQLAGRVRAFTDDVRDVAEQATTVDARPLASSSAALGAAADALAGAQGDTQPVPDCASTYPDGPAASRKFGDIAPTATPQTTDDR